LLFGTSIEFQRIEDGHMSLLLAQSRVPRSRSTATGGVDEMAGNVGAFPVRFAGAATAERLVAPGGRIKGRISSASRKKFSVDETRRATVRA
jgi:hypothetical protein